METATFECVLAAVTLGLSTLLACQLRTTPSSIWILTRKLTHTRTTHTQKFYRYVVCYRALAIIFLIRFHESCILSLGLKSIAIVVIKRNFALQESASNSAFDKVIDAGDVVGLKDQLSRRPDLNSSDSPKLLAGYLKAAARGHYSVVQYLTSRLEYVIAFVILQVLQQLLVF